MLNDILLIERGLRAHGISSTAKHPDVKDMAKGPAIVVRLGADGRISGIEQLAEAGRGAVWTLRDGQHNGFPGLRTPGGLLEMSEEERAGHERAWKAAKDQTSRLAEVLRLLDSYPVASSLSRDWPSKGHRLRIAERGEVLAPLSLNPKTSSVPAVFERFLKSLKNAPAFAEGLLERLSETVRNDDSWVGMARTALVGPVALVIDVGSMEFPRDASDPRQVEPVSEALAAAGATNVRGICALTGEAAELHRGTFPQPNLPGLGQTYLFARNSDIPSLTRYGNADGSFPVASRVIVRLGGAISHVTRDEAEDKSWTRIPAEKGDKLDLLITSLAADPSLPLAAAFADDPEPVAGESRWRELGQRAVRQTKGRATHEAASGEVLILVLRTVDPANRKAVYSRQTSEAELYEAAKRWQEAVANHPDWLAVPIPIKGEHKAELRPPPRETSPLSIVRLSKTHFIRGGKERAKVVGITSAEAFGLFLQDGNVAARARRILGVLLPRYSQVLGAIAAAKAKAKGVEDLKAFDPKTDRRRDALASMSWLSALLLYSGRTKEVFMADAAFRLGQLLAAADAIHIGYCTDVRGGKVPPTMLGNSVLTTAGADPYRAVSILAMRMKPYLAWAKRPTLIHQKADAEDANKEHGNARALRRGVSQARRSGPLAAELHASLEPYRTGEKVPDDVFRAELLLGYLAGLPALPKAPGQEQGEEDVSTDSEGGIEQ